MSWMCGEYCQTHPRHDHAYEEDLNHCEYTIFAPGKHTAVNNNAFSAYALHQQQMDDFVKLLAEQDDPNDPDTQTMVARATGLSTYSLTSDDIAYIEREVENLL